MMKMAFDPPCLPFPSAPSPNTGKPQTPQGWSETEFLAGEGRRPPHAWRKSSPGAEGEGRRPPNAWRKSSPGAEGEGQWEPKGSGHQDSLGLEAARSVFTWLGNLTLLYFLSKVCASAGLKASGWGNVVCWL